MKQEQNIYKYFPTSAMYNRYSNFRRLDLESLFFAFYYQQGTYQQYLAAQELKKRGWEFHIRFQTWMKKELITTSSNDQLAVNKGKGKSRTLYFDYENEWKVKTSTSPDLQVGDDPKFIENDLQVPTDVESS